MEWMAELTSKVIFKCCKVGVLGEDWVIAWAFVANAFDSEVYPGNASTQG
jgi:hypothetical protein